MTKSKTLHAFALLLILMLQSGCAIGGTPAPRQTTVWITFDPGGALTGSEATIYAQNVQTGQTFSRPYLVTDSVDQEQPSQPISITVTAPATYVFYGLLNIDSEGSHYGATGCKNLSKCDSSELIGYYLVPGQSYYVTVNNPAAQVPVPDVPVTVPWHKPSESASKPSPTLEATVVALIKPSRQQSATVTPTPTLAPTLTPKPRKIPPTPVLSAGETLLVFDSFQDDDNVALIDHRPDVVPPKSRWITESSSFTILAGNAVPDLQAQGISMNVINLPTPDVRIQVQMTSNDPQADGIMNGLIVRYRDVRNYLRVWLDRGTQMVRLEKVENNRVFLLDSFWLTAQKGETYTLTVQTRGADIRYEVKTPQGAILARHTTTDFNLLFNLFGIIGTQKGTSYAILSNLSIIGLAPAEADAEGANEPALIVWFNADNALNINGQPPADNQAAPVVLDLSGQANLGVAKTLDTSPSYFANAWDGKGVIGFDPQQITDYRFPAPFSSLNGITVATTFNLPEQIFTTNQRADLFRINSVNGNADQIGLYLTKQDQLLRVNYIAAGETVLRITLPISDVGKWHLLVWILDFERGILTFRIDGLTYESYQGMAPFSADGLSGSLGSANGSYPINALLREFRIYDRPLNLNQVQALEKELWPGLTPGP